MKVRKYLAALIAALLLLSLTGCGAAPENSMSMSDSDKYNRYDAEYGVAEPAAGDTADTEQAVPESRKWIITMNIDAETEDMDTLLQTLQEKITSLQGYVENQEINNGSLYSSYRYRSAYLTIRIPADQADNFLSHVSGVSNVTSSNKSMEDITLTYVATDSRVKALQAEEARLLELMAQAETMSDLLEIEQRLTDVRYQLESATSQLKVYDNLVDYATIHLSISEVQEYTPVEEETVWERISGGFVDSLKDIGEGLVDFTVWLLVSSPYLVLWGAIGTGIFLIVRKIRRKKPKQAPKPIVTDKPE